MKKILFAITLAVASTTTNAQLVVDSKLKMLMTVRNVLRLPIK